VSESLKCCNKCGAYSICKTKTDTGCCPECEYFDPIDNLCMAIPEKKKAKEAKIEDSDEVDPDTFLFEDDDEEDENTSDLPPKRESTDDDDW